MLKQGYRIDSTGFFFFLFSFLFSSKTVSLWFSDSVADVAAPKVSLGLGGGGPAVFHRDCRSGRHGS